MRTLIPAFAACFLLSSVKSSMADEYLTGIKWAEPPVVTPGAASTEAPSDAIQLVNGKDLKNWKNGERWRVKDGIVYAGKCPITGGEKFGD